MENTIKEQIASNQEKAALMERYISLIVRGNGVNYGASQMMDMHEDCAILAEIAADYSAKVSELLHLKDE